MQRLVVLEARTLTLQWDEEAECFEFRLMSGRRYVTPKLPFTPLDWYGLMLNERRSLGGWLVLARERALLEIIPIRELQLDMFGREPHQWPKVSFHDLYTMAERERGEKPEVGWERIYNAALEAERENWRPA